MTCRCPEGSCPGCYESAFGIDVGPQGANVRAAIRGFVLGAASGFLLGGPIVFGGLMVGALSGLFSDRIDTFLRVT